MQYRDLGRTGLTVSEIGLGGNTFGPPRLDRQASIACIHRAEDLGVNFVDTANIYGEGHSESFIGEAIAGRRDKWVVATKFNFWKMAPGKPAAARLRSQCDESLRRLGVDCIDLYQLHGPAPAVPVEEVFEELGRLAQAGKLRSFGVCNFASWRHQHSLDQARSAGWPEPLTSQSHYNLLRRHVELEMLPFCEQERIAFLPYHPLAGGFLTDKYIKGEPPPAGTRGAAGSPIVRRSRSARNEDIQDLLKQWAHARGHNLGELALAWLLSRPQVASVIAGVSSPAQVEANVQAGRWRLSAEELADIDTFTAWDGGSEAVELLLP